MKVKRCLSELQEASPTTLLELCGLTATHWRQESTACKTFSCLYAFALLIRCIFSNRNAPRALRHSCSTRFACSSVITVTRTVRSTVITPVSAIARYEISQITVCYNSNRMKTQSNVGRFVAPFKSGASSVHVRCLLIIIVSTLTLADWRSNEAAFSRTTEDLLCAFLW